METTTDTLMTGMFRDRESADRAYTAIQLRGYSSKEIYLLMSEDTKTRHFSGGTHTTNIGNKAMEGAGTGGAIGLTIGAIDPAIGIGDCGAIGCSGSRCRSGWHSRRIIRRADRRGHSERTCCCL